MTENLPLIKPDGSEQRLHTELTFAIAKALGDLILAGKAIRPTGKKELELDIEGKKETVRTGTIISWLTRDNVIPELGKTLKAYLDEKRAEKRLQDEQARQDTIRESAEKALKAITGLKISPVQVKTFKRVDRVTGQLETTRVEETAHSPQVMETVARVAMFGLERLNPQRYGAKVEATHKHFVFDLAALRAQRAAKLREQPMEII